MFQCGLSRENNCQKEEHKARQEHGYINLDCRML